MRTQLSGSEEGSRRAIGWHHTSGMKRDYQLCRVNCLHDSRVGDHQRLGLKGDKAGRVNVEDSAFMIRLLTAIVVRMLHVVVIVAVGIYRSMVICMRIDRQHVESGRGAIVQVMRVPGLRGCSARPHDRHGHDSRYDLTHPGHLIPDYTTHDYRTPFR